MSDHGDGAAPASPSRRRLLLAAPALLALAGCGRALRAPQPGERVLFVGNSLSYWSDVPGQFAQLASLALERPVHADLLAAPGAHIAHHYEAGVVQQALAEGGYSALVLQEFGGGLTCHEGLEKFGFSCEASKSAHAALAEAAGAAGAQCLLLGTYRQQRNPATDLVIAEAALAAEIGATHVGLGDFPLLKARHPDWAWLDPEDGQHPGPELGLLMALRCLRSLYGRAPQPQPLELVLGNYRAPGRPSLRELAEPLAHDRWSLSAEELEARLRVAGFEVDAGVH